MWIGPSFGIGLSERLSLGGGFYGVHESLVLKETWDYLFTRGDSREIDRVSSRTYNVDYTNYSLLALLGVNYRLDDHIIVGARIQTPTVNLGGSGEYLHAVSLGDPDRDLLVHADHMDTKNRLPTALSIGAAYKKPKDFSFEIDLTYHFPTSYTAWKGTDSWTKEPVEIEVRRKPVVNVNLGGEYYIDGTYPIRAGFFTNRSAAPDPAPGDVTLNIRQTDMYGVTLGVGSESEHTAINLGINYTWGSGKTLGAGEDFDLVVVDMNESHLFVFMSSAYIF